MIVDEVGEGMNVYLAGCPNEKKRATDEIMDIYLAGAGSAGNNNAIWRNGKENPDEAMNIFLAGLNSEQNRAYDGFSSERKIYVLESFYYMKDWMFPYIKNHWHFLLDSGAFTFMNDTKNATGVDWDEYTEKYANFIKKNDISLFFELDIDPIVGLNEVERLRIKLEKITDKQCIPVWHKSRGMDYWLKMVQEYDYVAIGGIVTQEIKRNEYSIFSKLLKIASENNCKVHGLGFTNSSGLKKYRFYSVDSTAWLYGNRGGFIYKFTGKDIVKIDKPKGKRLIAKKAAIHNFREWVKYQQYAKENL